MTPLSKPKRSELIRSPRFVCAFPKSGYRAIRLRAYKPENPLATEDYSDCTIWEAARATAAAPFYFPIAKIRGKKIWDGGLSYNNLVSEVLREATDLFGEHSVSCVVSLGTGMRPANLKPKKSIWPVLGKGKKVLERVTDVQQPHKEFEEDRKREKFEYFRFSPDIKGDRIGLADYKMIEKLRTYVDEFLRDPATDTALGSCAELLAREMRPNHVTSSRGVSSVSNLGNTVSSSSRLPFK